MKRLASAVLATLATALAASPSQAQIAVGGHVGTTGVGPDLQYRLNDNFTLRGAADWLDLIYGQSYDGVRYDGRMKLMTGGAFLDWHPWANPVFLSGGAYFGDRQVDISATPAATVTIGGQSFTPAEVGRLDGRIKMGSAAPFAGVGLDSQAGANAKGFGFKGLIGVAFSGRPTVDLSSTGGAFSNTSALLPSLDAERDRIADRASFLQYYPVAQVAVNYRF